MISTAHRFIYLHAPKTGGNSIQTQLLPLSDDEKNVRGHQDGVERFEVRGSKTPKKHALLSDYSAILGKEVDEYKIILSVRDPLTRAISYYFSPHRWMKRDGWSRLYSALGLPRAGKSYRSQRVFWDIGEFEKCLRDIVPLAEFLRLEGSVRRADYLIRFESIDRDFHRCMQGLGLSDVIEGLPHVNKSIAPEMVQSARTDPEVKRMVERYFAEDYRLFDY